MNAFQRAILSLLVALARLALEHDKGYASHGVRTAVKDAIADGEASLAAPYK